MERTIVVRLTLVRHDQADLDEWNFFCRRSPSQPSGTRRDSETFHAGCEHLIAIQAEWLSSDELRVLLWPAATLVELTCGYSAAFSGDPDAWIGNRNSGFGKIALSSTLTPRRHNKEFVGLSGSLVVA